MIMGSLRQPLQWNSVLPNTRAQRTRSSASTPRVLLTRGLLGRFTRGMLGLLGGGRDRLCVALRIGCQTFEFEWRRR